MPPVMLTWAYARAVLMVASDWAFGSALGYLVLTLFWSGHLGRGETWALAATAAIYTLNRVALLALIIHRRPAAEPTASSSACNHQSGSDCPPPDESAQSPARPDGPAPDTTTSPEAGRP